uniref:Uncharacterized protein TCIL3000_5_4090 n=1 Tax=Trypanosoma congolense (strain IL3000) TaxID=1068625 RepID=G0UM00_TRYCI|nr:unnamed protein product [Trypanosoma congolense IL3000]
MHAAVVTNVGLVVDAVIVARCLDDAELVLRGGSTGAEEHLCEYASQDRTPLMGPTLTRLEGRNASFSGRGDNTVGDGIGIGAGGDCRGCVNSSFTTVSKSILDDNVHYECRAVKRPLPQRIFHHFDVLPFGMACPSAVFSVLGRHTNRGLVVGLTHGGIFVVRPYPLGEPLKLVPRGADRKQLREEDILAISVASRSPIVKEEISKFIRCADHYAQAEKSKANICRDYCASSSSSDASVNDSNTKATNVYEDIEYYALKDLQLPPMLAVHDPIPPLRVGSRVIARRCCCIDTLHIARVCKVNYNVTYTLEYEADGAIERGVLHNDVHLLDEQGAEHCSVRDQVTVVLYDQEPALIIECCGDEKYGVVLDHNPGQAVYVNRSNIVFIAPLLKDALYSDPVILQWFRDLDPMNTGVVEWKDVRHLILGFEGYGAKLEFKKIGEIQRDLCLRVGQVNSQMLRSIPVQTEEMKLHYSEFEYVILRAKNLF